MTLVIRKESPLTSDARALIEGSESSLRAVYTADECFSFSPEELDTAETQFFIARKNDNPIGCVAICAQYDYAEIKRLFVTPAARGTGAAQRLMQHLEAQAKQSGYTVIRLETGSKLAAGVALYKKLGYRIRGPFGDYCDHPASLFMEKHL